MCSVDVAVDQLTRCNPCILMPRTLSFPEASSLSETGSRLGCSSNVSTRMESSSEGCCSPGLEWGRCKRLPAYTTYRILDRHLVSQAAKAPCPTSSLSTKLLHAGLKEYSLCC